MGDKEKKIAGINCFMVCPNSPQCMGILVRLLKMNREGSCAWVHEGESEGRVLFWFYSAKKNLFRLQCCIKYVFCFAVHKEKLERHEKPEKKEKPEKRGKPEPPEKLEKKEKVIGKHPFLMD